MLLNTMHCPRPYTARPHQSRLLHSIGKELKSPYLVKAWANMVPLKQQCIDGWLLIWNGSTHPGPSAVCIYACPPETRIVGSQVKNELMEELDQSLAIDGACPLQHLALRSNAHVSFRCRS